MKYGHALTMVIMGLLAVLMGCNSMQTSSAILRYQQGEYDMADSLAREALKVNPNDGEAYFYMALSQSELQNYGEAYKNFKKAAELKPSRAEMAQANIESNFVSAFRNGVDAFSSDKIEIAIEDFTTATQANPENPLGYTNLAKAYWAKAERLQEFAQDEYVENAQIALDNLSIGLEKETDPAKREETAQIKATILGNLYVDSNDEMRETFLTQYRDFMVEFPDYYSPHEIFANVLFDEGARLQELRRQKDTYLDYFLYSGEAFGNAMDIRERLGEADVDVARLAGVSYLNAEMYTEAAKYLDKAVKLDPNMEESWFYLEYSYFQSEDYDDAIEAGNFLDESIRTTNPDVFQILFRSYRIKAEKADEAGDAQGFEENKGLYEDAYITYATYKGEADTTPPPLLRKVEKEKAQQIENAIFKKEGVSVIRARVQGRFIRGVLINKTGDTLEYIELNFDLLDEFDEVIGSTYADLENVRPDREINFTAGFMMDGVESFEITDLFME